MRGLHWQGGRPLRFHPPGCRSRQHLLGLLGASLLVAACGTLPDRAAPAAPAEPVIRVSGSGTTLPLVQKLTEAFIVAHPGARFALAPGTNSGGAIAGLLDGVLELAVVNRPLAGTEASHGLLYTPVAQDAVAFAVHDPSPVQALSTAQLRAIYGGTLVDWQQLGGPSEPIFVLDRDADESVRRLVLLPLLAGQPVAARTIVLPTAREMLRALERTPHSLGYTGLGLLVIERPANVRVIALDGVMPTGASLASGTYPWSLTLGLVHHPDAPPVLQRFIAFVRGGDGRRLLEAYGYAAIDP